jgi:Rrf2 family iron-sulfur cluster assembly transcriptional regulator
VITASELTTFDLHCVSHPVEEERCSASHACSIRPVWVLLQQKIDDVLAGVRLSDLLHEESEVRARVGLPASAARESSDADAGTAVRVLPVLGTR